MAFGFLKELFSPEAGFRAIEASYEKHYALAANQNIEPVSWGLYGALGVRYKIRRQFVSEPVHMIEIVPFLMMGQQERVRALADYIMLIEIPHKIDIERVKLQINDAFRNRSGELATDAYDLLVQSVPYSRGMPIRWLAWLDEQNVEQLNEDFERTENEERN